MEKKPCHTSVLMNIVRAIYPSPFIRFNLKMCTTSHLGKEFKDVIPVSCNLQILLYWLVFKGCMAYILYWQWNWNKGREASKCHQSKWSVNVASRSSSVARVFGHKACKEFSLERKVWQNVLLDKKASAQIAGHIYSCLIHQIN